MIVTQQGAGIYFPHALPVSSLRPLTPPRSLKEIHCPLLSQLPPSSRVGKTIFHKKEQTNFLSFCPLSRPKVLFIAIRCVIPASTVNTWTLFDREKKKRNLSGLPLDPIFTNTQSVMYCVTASI